MDPHSLEDDIPDPFEVGDDDLEDERDPEPPVVQKTLSNEMEPDEQVVDSVVSDLPGEAPPLPPKEDAPPPTAGLQKVNLQMLLANNLFLPIPEADPLKVLLAKYVPDPNLRPQRDSSGDYTQSDLPTLVATNSWRATAKLARDSLLNCNPSDAHRILELWSLRLNSLARLRLYNQTAAECSGLFTALSSVQPPESREYLIKELLPLDLELCRARLRYWANDQLGYIDALMHIIKRCRYMAKRSHERAGISTSAKWLDKAARVSVVLASQLVEMKQYTTATRLLESMLASGASSPHLRSVLASIYLQIGDLGSASRHLEAMDQEEGAIENDIKANNFILKHAFLGDWEKVTDLLKTRQADLTSQENHVQKAIDANNLSVALLNQGKLNEAITVLEAAFRNTPSIAVAAEPLIFNLATMYELKSNTAMERKIGLLLQVSQWAGDGTRHTVLKLG